ncbi:MAG: DUF6528 family protein [Planctomycetota bacterium]|jgi:hypothetical protein
MARIIYLSLIIVVLALFTGGCAVGENNGLCEKKPSSDKLVVCGWDEVFIIDTSDSKQGRPVKLWSWKAQDSSELPERIKDSFGTTDECKVVDGGRKILITDSTGGIALVEIKSKKVLFYAVAANAHSAELLPGKRVAVAVSTAADGNRLILYALDRPEKELFSDKLPSGHGVIWDDERDVLWALADENIQVYRLKNWESDRPALERIDTIKLPERGGHDLYPVPNSNKLFVTTTGHVWVFDRDRKSFQKHKVIGDDINVKSVCVNPVTGQLVYIRADEGHWWSETIRFLNPAGVRFVEGEHFYKARWFTAER